MNNDKKIDKIISMLQELKDTKKNIIHYITFGYGYIHFYTLDEIDVIVIDISKELGSELLNSHNFADRVYIHVEPVTPLMNVGRLINYLLLKGYSIEKPDSISSRIFTMVK